MSGLPSKLRAYAELGRISNLPTTLTNVMVGVAIGAFGAVEPIESRVLWTSIALVWPPIACFYIAGMAMNDLADAKIDAAERPQRPIPSGRVPPASAMIFIVALFAIGLAMLAMINPTALLAGAALVAVIVMYNLMHARWTASVLLLGAARAGVYAVGAAAIAPDLNWEHYEVLAISIGLYTAGFSLVARREMQPRHKPLRWVVVLLPLIILVPLPFIRPVMFGFIAASIVLVAHASHTYIKSPTRVKDAIMRWIAVICFIDAMYLMALNQFGFALIAAGCFFATWLAQWRLSGT